MSDWYARPCPRRNAWKAVKNSLSHLSLSRENAESLDKLAVGGRNWLELIPEEWQDIYGAIFDEMVNTMGNICGLYRKDCSHPVLDEEDVKDNTTEESAMELSSFGYPTSLIQARLLDKKSKIKIEKDVNRTFGIFTRNEMTKYNMGMRYEEDSERYQLALFRVLLAATYERDYCQGLNFITAALLLEIRGNSEDLNWRYTTVEQRWHIYERRCFIILCYLMKECSMHVLFDPKCSSLVEYIKIFEKKLRKKNKDIYKFLKIMRHDSICYCVEWFTTCYITVCPGALSSSVLDLLLAGCPDALIKVGLAILEELEPVLITLSLEGLQKNFKEMVGQLSHVQKHNVLVKALSYDVELFPENHDTLQFMSKNIEMMDPGNGEYTFTSRHLRDKERTTSYDSVDFDGNKIDYTNVGANAGKLKAGGPQIKEENTVYENSEDVEWDKNGCTHKTAREMAKSQRRTRLALVKHYKQVLRRITQDEKNKAKTELQEIIYEQNEQIKQSLYHILSSLRGNPRVQADVLSARAVGGILELDTLPYWRDRQFRKLGYWARQEFTFDSSSHPDRNSTITPVVSAKANGKVKTVEKESEGDKKDKRNTSAESDEREEEEVTSHLPPGWQAPSALSLNHVLHACDSPLDAIVHTVRVMGLDHARKEELVERYIGVGRYCDVLRAKAVSLETVLRNLRLDFDHNEDQDIATYCACSHPDTKVSNISFSVAVDSQASLKDQYECFRDFCGDTEVEARVAKKVKLRKPADVGDLLAISGHRFRALYNKQVRKRLRAATQKRLLKKARKSAAFERELQRHLTISAGEDKITPTSVQRKTYPAPMCKPKEDRRHDKWTHAQWRYWVGWKLQSEEKRASAIERRKRRQQEADQTNPIVHFFHKLFEPQMTLAKKPTRLGSALASEPEQNNDPSSESEKGEQGEWPSGYLGDSST